MRRADRLFRITQSLRHDRAVTAQELARTLEVSERTVYRDIQELSASGVPIIAEPGTGYRLERGYRLPPLMFDEDEIAALLIGARLVRGWSDRDLAEAAERLLGKVEAVLPQRLLPALRRDEVLVPDFVLEEAHRERLAVVRRALVDRRKLRFSYRREDGAASERTVWPLGLFHWGRTWTLGAWCELRGEFRQFRIDRMEAPMAGEPFAEVAGRSLDDFLRHVGAE